MPKELWSSITHTCLKVSQNYSVCWIFLFFLSSFMHFWQEMSENLDMSRHHAFLTKCMHTKYFSTSSHISFYPRSYNPKITSWLVFFLKRYFSLPQGNLCCLSFLSLKFSFLRSAAAAQIFTMIPLSMLFFFFHILVPCSSIVPCLSHSNLIPNCSWSHLQRFRFIPLFIMNALLHPIYIYYHKLPKRSLK